MCSRRVFANNNDINFSDYNSKIKSDLIFKNIKSKACTSTVSKCNAPYSINDAKKSYLCYNDIISHIDTCSYCSSCKNNSEIYKCKEIKNILYPYGNYIENCSNNTCLYNIPDFSQLEVADISFNYMYNNNLKKELEILAAALHNARHNLFYNDMSFCRQTNIDMSFCPQLNFDMSFCPQINITNENNIPTQPPPNISVNVPTQPPPNISVNVPTQPPPNISVNVPTQPPPIFSPIFSPTIPTPNVVVNANMPPIPTPLFNPTFSPTFSPIFSPNIPMPNISVNVPEQNVVVNVPTQPAPIVNVPEPNIVVNVPEPNIVVNVPERERPIIVPIPYPVIIKNKIHSHDDNHCEEEHTCHKHDKHDKYDKQFRRCIGIKCCNHCAKGKCCGKEKCIEYYNVKKIKHTTKADAENGKHNNSLITLEKKDESLKKRVYNNANISL